MYRGDLKQEETVYFMEAKRDLVAPNKAKGEEELQEKTQGLH